MRIIPHFLPQNGFEPSPPELNTEKGILDIGSSSECDIIEESKIIAETLILRCKLRPIPYQNPGIKVKLISEGNAHQDALLYDNESLTYGYEREFEHSQFQAIALDYMGIGRSETFIFEGTDVGEGILKCSNPLYTKPFFIETENHVERTTSTLVSPPGVLNARILRGFGGYL